MITGVKPSSSGVVGVAVGVRRSGATRDDRAGAGAAAAARTTAAGLVVGDLLHHRDGVLPRGLDLVGVLLGLRLASRGPRVVEVHLARVDLQVVHLVGLVVAGLARRELGLVALVAVHLLHGRLRVAGHGHRVLQRRVDRLDVVGAVGDLLADGLEGLEGTGHGLLGEVLADRGRDGDQRLAHLAQLLLGVQPLARARRRSRRRAARRRSGRAAAPLPYPPLVSPPWW